MDSIQILRNLRKKFTTSFYGVFPSDRLPDHIVDRPAFIVANTDPAYKSGTHWVAFYLPKRGRIEYFDSFGRRPEDRNFIRFLQNNNNNDNNNTSTNKNSNCLKQKYCFQYNKKCLVWLLIRVWSVLLRIFI